MYRIGNVFGSRRNPSLTATIVVALAAPIVFGLANAAWPQSQVSPAASRQFTFDVVSVKPNKAGAGGGQFPTVSLDGFTARNVPLMRLLYSAFGIFEDYRFSGVPDWGRADRFDVEAKMDGAAADEMQKLSPDDRKVAQQRMQQALLADRFKLAFHSEMKEVPVYFLVVTKNGPKFHEADPESQAAGGRSASGARGRGPGETLPFRAVPISTLVRFLSVYMEQTVVDKTGLTAKYNLTITYGPEDSQDPNAPPIETALEQQLGLKLVSGKSPVEMIVIDHVERPSGN
ncbi:MAG: TIGR03435 family protein [Candidatus Acidiferrales bacterium]